MLKTQLRFIITIILVLGFSISLQSLIASWQEPTVAPPGDNIAKPVNEGLAYQIKQGSLDVLGDLGVSATSTVFGNFFVGGNSRMFGDLIVDENIGLGIAPTMKLDVNGKIKMRNVTTVADLDNVVATKGYVDDFIKTMNNGTGINVSRVNSTATVSFDCSDVDSSSIYCSGETLNVATNYRGAQARCGVNRFLDGDGDCRTASQIVSDGGGGGGSTATQYTSNGNLGSHKICAISRVGNAEDSHYCRVYKSGANWYMASYKTSCYAICLD